MTFSLTHAVGEVQHAIHRYFIWIIVSSYVIAAIYPGPGLLIRGFELGTVEIPGAKFAVSLPPVMLACLLFNAGLGIRTAELSNLIGRPSLLLAGVLANVLVPLAFISGVSLLMTQWHNSEEVQQILTGLALVASMPIAGASTAWAQNANGNLALSLGLILLTTLTSPIFTPIVLHSVGFITTGDYSEDLHELAQNGVGSFLGVWVILPSLLGTAAQRILGEKQSAKALPYVKIFNFLILVVLNYSNASLSLPNVVSQPDFDFIVVMLIIATLLCLLMFGTGYAMARAFQADKANKASLMFALGMNNNGAGLVLSSLALADHPQVMLPIIFYNLVQHFVASLVDRIIARGVHRRSASPVVIMRLFLITLALVVTTAFAISGALAQTSRQVAITKFAAKVVYAENRCPLLKVNTVGLVMFGRTHNVSIDDWRPGGRFRQLLEAYVAILKVEHDSSSDVVFCGIMEAHYGPSGITAPGAMMRR